MNRFRELIDAGVAPAMYKSWGKSVPGTAIDPVVVEYNAHWGAATDTHCDVLDDCFVITGSMVGDAKNWDLFLTLPSWRNVNFPKSLGDFMSANGLCGTYDILNGQIVYRMCRCH